MKNGGGSGPKPVRLLEAGAQFAYDRNYKNLEGVAVAANIPADEAFDLRYIVGRIEKSVRLAFTTVAARIFADPFTDGTDALRDLDDFTKNFPPFRFETPVAAPINHILKRLFEGNGKLAGHFIPLPAVAEYDTALWSRDKAQRAAWADDGIFGEQRLSGNNPIQVRRLAPDDARVAVLRAAVEAGTVDLPALDDDLRAGDVYVLDYTAQPYKDGQRPDFELPDDFEAGTYEESDGTTARRVLPRPLAFFKWAAASPDAEGAAAAAGQLLPVAIRVGLGDGSRVYVPADAEGGSHDWLFAKLCVQIADFNCHEMQTHLGKTHLAMEPFAVATRAHLPTAHPLSVLLRAHTRFLIFNNHLARTQLVGDDGPVEQLLAGTLASSIGLARVSVLSWGLFKDSLPRDVEARGMGDLPHYPYRDDGLLVWEQTARFAQDFVAAIYGSDEAVRGDRALQAWAASLADPDGGSVTEMPGSLGSRQQLADVLTAVIFTCGPQHSAINYTQFEYGGYTLNMPLAARRGYHDIVDRPRSKPISERELLTFLPNLDMTRQQLRIMFLLSAYRYDKLGHYDTVLESIYDEKESDLFREHPEVLKAIEGFRAGLTEAGDEIKARNSKRAVKYDFMHPDNIINSISI